MILEPQDQFKKFLESSKEVLILIPENPSADAVGASWALYGFLKKRGLLGAIAFSNNLSQKFDFLEKPEKIFTQISGARDFVLSFDILRNKIVKIRHEETDGKFNVYLTPERGAIDPRDFSFILAKFKYDLIVVIDSPDLEKLGEIYTKNPDLFFEVPVVNIDHRSGNDNFGQINLVDVTASSVAEILTQTMENIDADSIDKNIATCLLTGIIGATDSFQKKNTTPKALQIAASLMDRGANQQEIVRWMYKTHPLHILKLWGRAMAKLQWENGSHLAWMELAVEDFVQSRSNPRDLPLILEKLQENYSEGKIFMVLYNDTPETVIVLVKAVNQEIAKKVYPALDGEMKREVLEIKIIGSDLEKTGKMMAEKIKSAFNN
jgi:nanoRNase/pAp phosphatase (c-di-AMP/oligoRNAs hydrolase)